MALEKGILLAIYDALRYKKNRGVEMPRVIRRYENRKLYDTEEKRYVSLGDVSELVRQGHEIRVVDNKTGEDQTAQTLTKTLMEEGRRGKPGPPKAVLHELIRWGGRIRTSTAEQVEQGLDRLLEHSLRRLEPVRRAREDIDELRRRIEDLERLVADLAKNGRSRNSGRRAPRKEAESAPVASRTGVNPNDKQEVFDDDSSNC